MDKPNSPVSELRRPTPDYSTIDLLLDIRVNNSFSFRESERISE